MELYHLPNREVEDEISNLARGTWESARNLGELSKKLAPVSKNLEELNSNIDKFVIESKSSSKIMAKLTWALVFVGAM